MERIPTVDPETFILHQKPGYVVYENSDGRRWAVIGECVRLGHCMIGAVVDTPDGSTVIHSHEYLDAMVREWGPAVLGEMDTPVAPGFRGCCQFHFVECEGA